MTFLLPAIVVTIIIPVVIIAGLARPAELPSFFVLELAIAFRRNIVRRILHTRISGPFTLALGAIIVDPAVETFSRAQNAVGIDLPRVALRLRERRDEKKQRPAE